MRRFRQSTPTSVNDLDANPLQNLPHDVIVEVLLRLPVKSLLKFKCVSKSWCSLISSKKFAKAHLDISSNATATYTSHRLLFSTGYHSELKWSPLQSALYYNAPHIEASDIECPVNYSDMLLIGSSNGLVCIIIHQKYIYLWNPSIRKSKKLPHPGFNPKFFSCTLFGFGYDKLNDDYKVVGIKNTEFGNNEFELYSRKTNSWKRIEDYKYNGLPRQQFDFLDGKLHFILDIFFASESKIVSFDLAKETFGEMAYPDPFYLVRSLGVLGGCLAILGTQYAINGVDVWIMMDYGVKESWTKVAFVPFSDKPRQIIYYCTPVFMSKNGEILLKSGWDLVLYNSKSSSVIRYSELPIKDNYNIMEVATKTVIAREFSNNHAAGLELVNDATATSNRAIDVDVSREIPVNAAAHGFDVDAAAAALEGRRNAATICVNKEGMAVALPGFADTAVSPTCAVDAAVLGETVINNVAKDFVDTAATCYPSVGNFTATKHAIGALLRKKFLLMSLLLTKLS
ncbi:hypothetical protein ACH5RR_031706 [Cinchona calisaya]|uniref:F-box domain-containing protein n=1 Tax=Cinchona calisaya TaxID=153742 RepID=A0ABD2YG01_9GENT